MSANTHWSHTAKLKDKEQRNRYTLLTLKPNKAHGHAQCQRGREIYSFHVAAWGGYIFFVNNLIVLLPSTYVEFLYTRYICVVQLYSINVEVPMPLYDGHPEMTHRG